MSLRDKVEQLIELAKLKEVIQARIDLNKYGNSYNLFVFSNTNITDVSMFDFSKAETLTKMFSECPNIEKIEVDVSSARLLARFCYNSPNLKKVIIKKMTDAVSEGDMMFQSCGNLESVETLNLKSLKSYDGVFRFCNKLKDVGFVPETIMRTLNISWSPDLTDNSLVNTANGLNSTVTGQTLKLHTTSKTRCSTIKGTVTDGTFVQNENGTVSLTTFITTNKGWTLA